jgi:hypothetical protein
MKKLVAIPHYWGYHLHMHSRLPKDIGAISSPVPRNPNKRDENGGVEPVKWNVESGAVEVAEAFVPFDVSG